jgi:hypothetical protein
MNKFYLIVGMIIIASCAEGEVQDMQNSTIGMLNILQTSNYVIQYEYEGFCITRLAYYNGDNYFFYGKYSPDTDFSALDSYIYSTLSLWGLGTRLRFNENGSVGLSEGGSNCKLKGTDSMLYIIPDWGVHLINGDYYMYSSTLDSALIGNLSELMDKPNTNTKNVVSLQPITCGLDCQDEYKNNILNNSDITAKYYKTKKNIVIERVSRNNGKNRTKQTVKLIAEIIDITDSTFTIDYYYNGLCFIDTLSVKHYFQMENYYIGDKMTIMASKINPNNYSIYYSDVLKLNDNNMDDSLFFQKRRMMQEKRNIQKKVN